MAEEKEEKGPELEAELLRDVFKRKPKKAEESS